MYEVMAEMFEISSPQQNIYDLEVVAEMVMRLRAKHRDPNQVNLAQSLNMKALRELHHEMEMDEVDGLPTGNMMDGRMRMETNHISDHIIELEAPSKWRRSMGKSAKLNSNKTEESMDADAPSTVSNGNGDGHYRTTSMEAVVSAVHTAFAERESRPVLDVIPDPRIQREGTIDTNDLDGEYSDDLIDPIDNVLDDNGTTTESVPTQYSGNRIQFASRQELLHFLWTDFVAEFGVVPRSSNQFMAFSKRWGETVTFQEAADVISRYRSRRRRGRREQTSSVPNITYKRMNRLLLLLLMATKGFSVKVFLKVVATTTTTTTCTFAYK